MDLYSNSKDMVPVEVSQWSSHYIMPQGNVEETHPLNRSPDVGDLLFCVNLLEIRDMNQSYKFSEKSKRAIYNTSIKELDSVYGYNFQQLVYLLSFMYHRAMKLFNETIAGNDKDPLHQIYLSVVANRDEGKDLMNKALEALGANTGESFFDWVIRHDLYSKYMVFKKVAIRDGNDRNEFLFKGSSIYPGSYQGFENDIIPFTNIDWVREKVKFLGVVIQPMSSKENPVSAFKPVKVEVAHVGPRSMRNIAPSLSSYSGTKIGIVLTQYRGYPIIPRIVDRDALRSLHMYGYPFKGEGRNPTETKEKELDAIKNIGLPMRLVVLGHIGVIKHGRKYNGLEGEGPKEDARRQFVPISIENEYRKVYTDPDYNDYKIPRFSTNFREMQYVQHLTKLLGEVGRFDLIEKKRGLSPKKFIIDEIAHQVEDEFDKVIKPVIMLEGLTCTGITTRQEGWFEDTIDLYKALSDQDKFMYYIEITTVCKKCYDTGNLTVMQACKHKQIESSVEWKNDKKMSDWAKLSLSRPETYAIETMGLPAQRNQTCFVKEDIKRLCDRTVRAKNDEPIPRMTDFIMYIDPSGGGQSETSLAVCCKNEATQKYSIVWMDTANTKTLPQIKEFCLKNIEDFKRKFMGEGTENKLYVLVETNSTFNGDLIREHIIKEMSGKEGENVRVENMCFLSATEKGNAKNGEVTGRWGVLKVTGDGQKFVKKFNSLIEKNKIGIHATCSTHNDMFGKMESLLLQFSKQMRNWTIEKNGSMNGKNGGKENDDLSVAVLACVEWHERIAKSTYYRSQMWRG